MRAETDREKIDRFMTALGERVGGPGRIYDLYSQALAKIERGHARDLNDVQEMLARQLIEPGKLEGYFLAIESKLTRYPAIEPQALRAAVIAICHGGSDTSAAHE